MSEQCNYCGWMEESGYHHDCRKELYQEMQRQRGEIERLLGIMNSAEDVAEDAGRPEGERVDKSVAELVKERDEARDAARSYRESWCIHAFHEVLPLTESEPKWLDSATKAVAEPEEREGEG